MIFETYLLYTLPLLTRLFMSVSTSAIEDIVLSHASVLVILPSTLLPRIVQNTRREHVYRHAVYALAFTVAVPTTIHIELLEGPFLYFTIMGFFTLWWFVLSHMTENHMDKHLKTHQGDIAVLPLTLVAISAFILDVPTDVFRFTRSTIFLVPIIVAWATMFFLAFQQFATQCITTHEHPAFLFYAYASLIIAITHLLLIETEATAHTYQVFPLVAALFCQCITDFENRPKMRPRRHIATVVWSAGASALLFYNVMRLKLNNGGIFITGNICISLVLPPVNGTRWVFPGCALVTIVTWVLYETTSIHDLLALAASHLVVLLTTDLVARPVRQRIVGGVLSGTTIKIDKRTNMGRDTRWWMFARQIQLLESNTHSSALVATWFVPGIRFLYAEQYVTFQTREEFDEEYVLTIVA